METAGGTIEVVPAPDLVASSVAALPGVLTVGKRKGANAPAMRVRGIVATLSPLVGTPVAQK
eukprot:2323405-Pleurochrysis_carterae.AAC.1